MMFSFSVLVNCLLLVASTQAQQLVASLDYGTFKGSYSSTYNISYWRKIPYAAPPVGENRFRAPQPPLPITNGTYNSDQAFDMCPQRTVNGSEDCLYLGLYSRPWDPSQPLRPVVVTFYGGGFIQGSASFTIPPSAYPILNVSSSNDILFLYPNYRVNAFGFLPGKQVAEDPKSDLNCAFLDQQAVLKWTRRYIKYFGGDPEDVAVWGQSAGGGSVVAQVLANGGETNPPLFNKALASSPFWPKTYDYDAPEAQAIYDRLAELTGCEGKDSLKCLKNVDVQTIRNASLSISGSHQYNSSTFTWGPVIEGGKGFLRERLSVQSKRGKVNGGKIWGMYNTHEGENFIPPGLATALSSGSPPFNSSLSSFKTWLHGFLPDLSARDIRRLEEVYPVNGEVEGISGWNTTYVRAGVIYRDLVLACPAYWIAEGAHRKRGMGFVGEYMISPAKHASDTIYWNQVNAVQKSQPLIYTGYAGAFASFFATGDPNTHKLTNESQPGVPEIGTGKEFVIREGGFENLGITGKKGLEERCEFWREVGGSVDV